MISLRFTSLLFFLFVAYLRDDAAEPWDSPFATDSAAILARANRISTDPEATVLLSMPPSTAHEQEVILAVGADAVGTHVGESSSSAQAGRDGGAGPGKMPMATSKCFRCS